MQSEINKHSFARGIHSCPPVAYPSRHSASRVNFAWVLDNIGSHNVPLGGLILRAGIAPRYNQRNTRSNSTHQNLVCPLELITQSNTHLLSNPPNLLLLGKIIGERRCHSIEMSNVCFSKLGTAVYSSTWRGPSGR